MVLIPLRLPILCTLSLCFETIFSFAKTERRNNNWKTNVMRSSLNSGRIWIQKELIIDGCIPYSNQWSVFYSDIDAIVQIWNIVGLINWREKVSLTWAWLLVLVIVDSQWKKTFVIVMILLFHNNQNVPL